MEGVPLGTEWEEKGLDLRTLGRRSLRAVTASVLHRPLRYSRSCLGFASRDAEYVGRDLSMLDREAPALRYRHFSSSRD